MRATVLVLGYSGSGKSTSLRNFEPEEVGVLNVAGKPLPFRKHLDAMDNCRYADINRCIMSGKRRAWVVDDANYLMQFANFARAKQQGYGKFTDMAVDFEQMLEAAKCAPDGTITYIMMHPETDESGRLKPKTVGKMIDNQLNIEGLCPIVLVAERDKDGFWFATNSEDGSSPAKSPMGMFDEMRVPNDLKAVDAAIREYWGMPPLAGGGDDGSAGAEG